MTTKIARNDIPSGSEASNSFLDSMEKYLDSLESAPKPWYLCSSIIYKAVKDSVSAIPRGKEMFEKGVGALSTLATYINTKTSAGIQVLDLDKAYELLGQLDGVLADQCIVMDDGLDGARGKLSASLRQLVGSIVHHKEFLEKLAFDKMQQANAQVHTRYEQVLQLLDSLVKTVKEKYPESYHRTMLVYEQVGNKAEEYKTVVDNAVTSSYTTASSSYDMAWTKVAETQSMLLKTAQPYVQNAVARSQPLIAQATPYVEPLAVKAKPLLTYLDPMQEAIQANAYVGPYVKTAMSTAFLVLEDAKAYCGLQPAADEPIADATTANAAPLAAH